MCLEGVLACHMSGIEAKHSSGLQAITPSRMSGILRVLPRANVGRWVCFVVELVNLVLAIVYR